ncbi:gliding motility lipoprotein GldH [Winogradskyella maritima]|uniref:Gliding motility lipoprotein GldH n=1 Tax=Winogradskyella maritima TaxID=1517766 RepID=A0ABV8AE25_9FLAO|nr:gliding motility lipoprotein GldH [Winogradskyella maritima]
MPKRTNQFLVVLVTLLAFSSCDSNRVYDEYQSLPKGWDKNEIIRFQVKDLDTSSSHNLFINVRTNNDYKYNNLFLIAELSYPNGKTITDTLEYKMAAPNGELLGKGFTDVKESKLWYKGHEEPFQFIEEGEYAISIEQAMRKSGDVSGVDTLEGITEVGFRIEHTN